MATAQRELERATIERLAGQLRGEVIAPGEPSYDEARAVWNASADRYPALVARCHGVADVVEALRFARSAELPVAVRGGGHSVAGYGTCDGGLVVDLSPMQAVHVDPQARTATAEGGALGAAFDRETQAFGLATTLGIVSSTGSRA